MFDISVPEVLEHIAQDIRQLGAGFGETFGMIVHDYAGNSKTYTVKVPGNSDDYGIVKPTNVLWTETFDNAGLPAEQSLWRAGQSAAGAERQGGISLQRVLLVRLPGAEALL